LDLEKREDFIWRGEGEAMKRRNDAKKILCGFLLVDWSCWDFGLVGQEI
jgi:hypothetical protein